MSYSFHKKNFNLEWDEENGIVSLEIIGDQDEKGSANLYEALLSLSHKLEDEKDILEFKVLNDISKAKKITRQAFRIQVTFLRDFRIEKMAIIGATFFRKNIIDIMYRSISFRKVKFFKGRKEAVDWLRG